MARMYIADKPTLDLVKTTLETTTNTNISTALARLGTSSSSGSSTVFGLLNSIIANVTTPQRSIINKIVRGANTLIFTYSTSGPRTATVNHTTVNLDKSIVFLHYNKTVGLYLAGRSPSSLVLNLSISGTADVNIFVYWEIIEFN